MSERVFIDGQPFIPYWPERLDQETGLTRGLAFHDHLDRRRSVRFFSDAPVPREMIETAIRAASTAPSGAHQQPWTFVAISDPAMKAKIREAAEHEEKISYEGGRMPEEWKEALPEARQIGALRAALSEGAWVLRYLVPKLVRVARGVSSGDGRVAKRPSLRPLD